MGEGPAVAAADLAWMDRALALLPAAAGDDGGEGDDGAADIPVAALVVSPDGLLIGSGTNNRTRLHDPTAHAEVVALRTAAARRGTWRLDGCTVVVTLEPCPMCAGAIGASRAARVVFGAWNPDYGAAGSLFDLLRDPRLPHRVEVVAGVRGEECARRLAAFFGPRRRQPIRKATQS